MALQHLRSSTASKRPVPGSMSDGQLAINTNLASPGLFFKDSNGDLVKVGPVHVGSTAPNASPAAGGQTGNTKGEQWLDTSSSRYVFKIWDGSAWRTEDGEFVNASGDTMTGALGVPLGSAGSPSIYPGSDTNTGLYSPGADQIALGTNGQQRLAIDSSGRVLVGPGTARAVGGATVGTLAVETLGLGVSCVRNSADTSGGILALGKSRGTAAGDVTVVQNGDILGEIRFAGANGTDLTSIGAHIRAIVDGEVGTAGDTTDMPTQLTFSTTPDGAATATQRMVIDSSGRLGLGTSSVGAKFQINVQDGFRFDVGANAYSYMQFGSANTGEGTGEIGFERTTGNIYIKNGNSGSTLNTCVTVQNTGRVGIGTTNPQELLHVNTSASGGQVLRMSTNGADVGYLYQNTSAVILGAYSTRFLGFETNGTERARIDSSGRLLVGTSTSVWGGGIESMRTTGLQYVGGRFSADNFPAEITVLKSRGASVGTNTIVQNNDVLGNINFLGADGTTYLTAVQISAQVDGTPGTNDMPSRLVFSTTADGASSPTERMRIKANGTINFSNVATYADNAAATSGGLAVGDVYRTSTGQLMIRY